MSAQIYFFDVPLPLPRNKIDLAGFFPPREWNGTGGGLTVSFMKISCVGDKTLLLACFDVLFVDLEFKKTLEKRLGSSIKLILIASHTHNSPNLAKSVNSLGNVDQNWYRAVINTVVDAVNQRLDGDVELKFSFSSMSTSLNVNRRKLAYALDYSSLRRGDFKIGKQITMAPNENGVVDNQIRVITFRDAASNVKACIWSFSAHAVFHHDRNGISPDFPGLVRERLKEIYGQNCVVMFLPGLAGSSIPKCASKRFLDKTIKEMLLGLLPFHSAIEPVDASAYEVWCNRLSDDVVRGTEAPFELHLDASEVEVNSITTAPIFLDKTRGGLNMNIEVLRLSKSLVIEISNGELLAEWLTVLNSRGDKGINRITTGYGAGDCLYIPPYHEIIKGGYEVDRFKAPFGLDGNFKNDIDEIFIGALNQSNIFD